MFKTAARKIAHNSTLPALGGNKDLRPLQDLITAEKTVLISLQKLSVDFSKASEALRAWGLGEGDDLGDILSASTTILTHFSSALSQYATHGHQIREHLKAIRTREEALDALKRRRRTVMSEADSADRKLSKMNPEHKNLQAQTDTLYRLREEIRTIDSDIMTEEAALGDFKRFMTRTLMGLKFGGLLECCEKGTIAGEFGKLVIAEIPEETTQPGAPRSMYYGQPKTESIVAETHRCISQVTLTTVPVASPREPRRFDQLPTIPEPQLTGQGQGFLQGSALSFTDGNSTIGSSGGWTPRLSNEMSPPSGASYLPPMQGLGQNNRFLEPSDSSGTMGGSSSFMSQPYQQQQQQQGSPTEQRHTIPERTVDDFGVNTRPSGLLDTSDTSGGRFATFPVKNRPMGAGAGYTLRDDPPSLAARHEMGQSLSQSIADALSDERNPSGHRSHGSNGSRGLMDPVPPYEGPFPTNGGPAPLPPGAAPPVSGPPPDAKPWAALVPRAHSQLHARNRSEQSEDGDGLLAYMTSPHDASDGPDSPMATQHQQQPSGQHHNRAGFEHEDHEKHVRFGSVSDVDDEIERRGPKQPVGHHPSGSITNEESTASANTPSSSAISATSPPDTHSEGPRSPVVESHVSPEPTQTPTTAMPQSPKEMSIPPTTEQPTVQQQPELQPQSAPQHRIPPPAVLSPEEEEHELNAAAAREVSRELDALNFSPPTPITLDFKRNSQIDLSVDRGSGPHSPKAHSGNTSPNNPASTFGYNNNNGYPQQSQQPQREPSPLAPPSAPFTKRSISPHPYAELNPGPPYTPTQTYPQSFQPQAPYVQNQASPAQTYAQSYQASSPYGQSAHSPYDHSHSTPDIHTPPLNNLPPRFQALNQSPILTPSEPPPQKNPLPPRFAALNQSSPNPPPHDGQPSPTSPLPPRLQNLSQPSLGDGFASTGNSPYRTPPEYPRGLSANTFSKSNTSLSSPVAGTPGARTISAAAFKRPPPRKASGSDAMGSIGTDPSMRMRLPSSPYPQRSAPPPDQQMYPNAAPGGGRDLPMPPAGGAEEEEYDYISAYVDSGNNGSPQQEYFGGAGQTRGPGDPTGPAGYGDGRYATNLEGGGLR
ncbi:hypothetical protein BDQ12DRAFT_692575 [Crucibulum laeve]|uniref:Eisosome component PIL1-domain-containing protein n=1 Tax=Crucibulum laeve TaxID=68775 RepID=A0A5C3LHT0_9AGAR|nr:hypothetical protein BDQ12DRAFT_692575 [Crucibulum laeve]